MWSRVELVADAWQGGGDCGFKLLHDHHCRIWLCCIALAYVGTLAHTGGSAPLPVKTQMYYRTVLPRNMRVLALSQENTEVCCACSVVEQSVHWETGGSARRLFTIQGHPQPSRPGILWGGREWIIGHKSAKASFLEMLSLNSSSQELSNCPSVQEFAKPFKCHYTALLKQVCCISAYHFGIEHTVASVQFTQKERISEI